MSSAKSTNKSVAARYVSDRVFNGVRVCKDSPATRKKQAMARKILGAAKRSSAPADPDDRPAPAGQYRTAN